MIVGDPAVSGGLDALVKASYNLSVTIQDVEAQYTSPSKQFVVNVSACVCVCVCVFRSMGGCWKCPIKHLRASTPQAQHVSSLPS